MTDRFAMRLAQKLQNLLATVRNIFLPTLAIIHFGISHLAVAERATVMNPTPGTSTSWNVELTGTVVTSLTVTVDTPRVTMSPAGAAGTINFGSKINLADPISSNNADISTRDHDNNGIFVGAVLSASVAFPGLPGADITIERLYNAGSAPDVAPGLLRFQRGTGNLWTDPSHSGEAIPNPQTTPLVVCGDGVAGGASCANHESNLHEIVVYIPDNQLAGTFKTFVRYTATGG